MAKKSAPVQKNRPKTEPPKKKTKAQQKAILHEIDEAVDGLIDEFTETLDDPNFLIAMDVMQSKSQTAQDTRKQEIEDAEGEEDDLDEGEDDGDN